MPNDFVTGRHKTYSTPPAAIRDIVYKATGHRVVYSEKIVKGYENEVYAATTEQGTELVVRLRRFGSISFEQEAWAMEQCRRSNIPVPAVIAVDTVSDQPNVEAMVLTRLQGNSLADLRPNLGPGELSKLLSDAGKVLRCIHDIFVGGFYQRQSDGTWDFPDWESVMKASIRDRIREKDLILASGFSTAEFDRMMQLMNVSMTQYPGPEPVLNHGDYLAEHIFIKDERISGIIDFGMFQGAPPVHDLAYILMEEGSMFLEGIYRGYSDGEAPGEEFMTGLNLYRLGLQIGHLAHASSIGDHASARTLASGLKQLLMTLTPV